MAKGNSTISFTFKVEDDGKGLKTLTADADSLRKLLGSTVKEAERLKKPLISFAAVGMGLDQINSAFSGLNNACRALTDAYQIQKTAETQLETVMRQRMDASDEMISSIKELASEQQKLGVIGDEVQLSGAQQMATFLTETDSIKTLLPAMNNLLAQQKGLNATNQDAVNIGNLIGKAMQGQTAALRRVGITFDDAQEKVMKYGTEAQRAAMMAEIITANVGNMNAELAKTPIGKLKQAENWLGDIKEQIGSFTVGIQPLLTFAASMTTASTGAFKLYKSIAILVVGTKNWFINLKSTRKVLKETEAGVASLDKTEKVATATTRGFSLAIKGLLISTGVGAAIWALVTIIDHLTNTTDEATEGFDELKDASQAYATAAGEIKQSIDNEILSLRALIAANGDTSEAVDRLNRSYGDIFGTYQTASEWLDILTQKGENYVRMMGHQAKANELTKSLATTLGEQDEAKMRMDKLVAEGKDKRVVTEAGSINRLGISTYETNKTAETKEYKKARADYEAATKKVEALRSELALTTECINENKKALDAENKSVEIAEMRYKQLGKALEANEKALKAAAERNDKAELKRLKQERAQIEARQKLLDSRTGLNTPKTSEGNKKNYQLREQATRLNEIRENISYYQQKLETATAEEAVEINKSIELWRKKEKAILDAGKALKSQKTMVDDPKSINDYRNNIDILKTRRDETKSLAVRLKLTQEIYALEKELDLLENDGKPEEKSDKPVYDANAKSLKGYNDNIAFLNEQLENTTDLNVAAELNKQIEKWQKLADAVRNAGKAHESTFNAMRKGYENIKSIGSGVNSITEAIEGNGNAWQKLTGIVDGFLQVYDGIMAIVNLIHMFTQDNHLFTASEKTKAGAVAVSSAAQAESSVVSETTTAAEIPLIAANKALTQSYMELAAAEYVAAHASIPFAGFGIASGFIASATALVQSMNAIPFAEGGIVSGPTLGLIGEYAGASHNPEIVAPLSKLSEILQPAGQPVVVGGAFKVRGRDLICVAANETRISGKPTNIKI